MLDCAREGTCLGELIEIVVPICRIAEERSPRIGPGRKPEIPDWVLAALHDGDDAAAYYHVWS